MYFSLVAIKSLHTHGKIAGKTQDFFFLPLMRSSNQQISSEKEMMINEKKMDRVYQLRS